MTIRPSFLFDLDGTLVDSVYEHVLAWQEALTTEGIDLAVWRIHRRIGMSGGLFTNQLLRETKTSGRMITAGQNLAALAVDPLVNVVVTRDDVKYAKPDPDMFIAAAERLNVPITSAVVVGDSIWDMLAARRCQALGVALTT